MCAIFAAPDAPRHDPPAERKCLADGLDSHGTNRVHSKLVGQGGKATPMKVAAIFLLPLGVVMFAESNLLWRLVTYNQHVAVAWLFVSLVLCALGLYSLKMWSRLVYGALELGVGATITLGAINAYGVAQDHEITPIVGVGFFHKRPEGVFQLSGPEVALFAMLAAVYIMVRGLDNIGEGLRVPTVEDKRPDCTN